MWVMIDALVSTDGNTCLASSMNQALAQSSSYRPWPGFRHPCRNDGFSGLAGLVYNDKHRSVGTILNSTAATLCRQKKARGRHGDADLLLCQQHWHLAQLITTGNGDPSHGYRRPFLGVKETSSMGTGDPSLGSRRPLPWVQETLPWGQ